MESLLFFYKRLCTVAFGIRVWWRPDLNHLLLFGAGQEVDLTLSEQTFKILLKHDQIKLELKHICKQTRRKHLPKLD